MEKKMRGGINVERMLHEVEVEVEDVHQFRSRSFLFEVERGGDTHDVSKRELRVKKQR